MSQDVVVHWTNGTRPTQVEVESVLINFFSGAVESIEWNEEGSRFTVTLPGKGNSPMHGLDEKRAAVDKETYGPPFDRRYFEVFLDEEFLSVITRMQDRYTNTLARGLAEVFALHWRGSL